MDLKNNELGYNKPNNNNNNGSYDDSKIKESIKEINSQLEHIANKGTTVEVLERVTKEEIERQILDGTITNLTIENYSITEEKLDFPIVKGIASKNLFNKANAKLGGYFDTSSGLWVEDNSSGLCGSEFIKIEPNSIYTLAFESYKCFYDSNKKIIKNSENGYDNKVITPSNAKYCTISFKYDNIDLQQMIKGDSVGDFIPYGNTIDFDYFPKNSIGNDLIASGAIKNGNIENGTITKEKFKNGAISLEDVNFSVPSKNLFNKNNATLNKYIDISNGNTIVEDPTLSYSDFISVENDTEYSLNYTCYLLYYDEYKNFIKSTSKVSNFTTPSNCYYIILDFNTVNLNALQLEKGNVSTPFVEYGYKINTDFIPKSSYENMIIVSKDGKGDCDTIQKAVEQADDGDIIIVMPGEYEEYVICGSKNVSIIGVDRQKCILYNTTGDYNKCPLYINKGHVKNLTIKLIYDDNNDYSNVNSYGYAVHIDNYGENGELIIEHCDVLSDFNSTFGCGATPNHKLIIRNCNIESTNKSGLVNASSFAYHGGAEGCEADIILDNNRWKSNWRDIWFQTDGTPNTLRISAFYNNCSTVVIPYQDEIYFVNDNSFGNKNELLNGQ